MNKIYERHNISGSNCNTISTRRGAFARAVNMSLQSIIHPTPTLRKVDHSPISEGQLLSLWFYNGP